MNDRRPSIGGGQRRPSVSARSQGSKTKDYAALFKGKSVSNWGFTLKAKILLDKWFGSSGGKLYNASKDALAHEQAEYFAKEFGLDKESILAKVHRDRIAKRSFSNEDKFKVLQALLSLVERAPDSNKKALSIIPNKENFEENRTKILKALEETIEQFASTFTAEQLSLLSERLDSKTLNGIGLDLWRKDNNSEKAFELFEAGATKENPDPSALANLGDCYLNGYGTDGNPEMAGKNFIAALKIKPDLKLAQDGIVQLLQKVDISEDLNDQLKSLDSKTLNSIGLALRGKDVFSPNAFLLTKVAVEKDPSSLNALANLGDCYLKGYGTDKKPELAAKNFIAVLKIDLDHKLAQDGLVEALKKVDNISVDLMSNLKALDSKTLDGLGAELRTPDSYDKAFALFKAAVTKDPKNPNALANLGDCYLNGYGTDPSLNPAAKHFIEALKIKPDLKFAQKWLVLLLQRVEISKDLMSNLNALDSKALNGLGVKLRTPDSYDKAFALFEAAVTKDPRNPNALANLGHCYLKDYGTDKKPELAAKHFIEALKIKPDLKSAQKWLVLLLQRVEISPELKVQLEGLDSKTLNGLGVRFRTEKSYDKAFALFQIALQKDPTDITALTGLVAGHMNGRWTLDPIPENMSGIINQIEGKSIDELKVLAVDGFKIETAKEEDCLRQILINAYRPELFELSKLLSTPIAEGGEQARFNLNCAKIRLAQLQGIKGGSAGTVLNLAHFLNDPRKEEWDVIGQVYETVSDDAWNDLQQKLREVINQLYPGLENQQMLENAVGFFEKSMLAKDARDDSAGKGVVRGRVASVINFLLQNKGNEEQLNRAKEIVKIMADGGSACPDRVIVMLGKAELKIKTGEKPELMLNVLVDIFKENAIQAKLVDMSHDEALETFLYYTLKLKEALGLSTKTKSMLYAGCSRTPLNMNQAIDKLFEAFTEEDLIGYVAMQGEWRVLHEDKLTDFQNEKYALIYTISDEGQSTDDIIKTISPEDQKMLLKFFNKESMDELITAAKDEEIFDDMESSWVLKAQDLGDIFYERQAKEDLIEAGFLTKAV